MIPMDGVGISCQKNLISVGVSVIRAMTRNCTNCIFLRRKPLILCCLCSKRSMCVLSSVYSLIGISKGESGVLFTFIGEYNMYRKEFGVKYGLSLVIFGKVV